MSKTMVLGVSCMCLLTLVSSCVPEEELGHEIAPVTELSDASFEGERAVMAHLAKWEPDLHSKVMRFGNGKRQHIFADLYVRFKDVNGFDNSELADMVQTFASHPAVLSNPVRELPAGSILEDGTVAGEKEAIEYLKEREPVSYERLMRVPEETRRDEFGKLFVWFQRVGNYRKRQKAEMIEQIRLRLDLMDMVQQ